MAHSISGMIAPVYLSAQIATNFSLVCCPLDAGLAFLPFDGADYDRLLPLKSGLQFEWAEDWYLLSSDLVSMLCGVSGQHLIAYVETEYFGGIGTQGAVLFRRGAVVWGPERVDGSINRALRLMGVRASHRDEFDTVGLGRERSNEDFRMLQEGDAFAPRYFSGGPASPRKRERD